MKYIALTLLTISIFLASCSSNKTEGVKQENTTSGTTYTCPMDKEVSSDKPGACPKCGMDLVKK